MEIKKVVTTYLVDKLTTSDIAHVNLMDDMIIIVKGSRLDDFNKQLKENYERRVSQSVAGADYSLSLNDEIFRDMVQIESGVETSQQEIKATEEFIRELGKKYPMIQCSDDCLSISYNGNRRLDVADPNFFKLLDRLIDHIIQNDGISEFSEPV